MSTGLTVSQVSLLFKRLRLFLDPHEIRHHCRSIISLIHRELANVELAQLLLTLAFQALLLQTIFQLFLKGTGFEGFGVFPNRQRPKCTTMPWNIWPSLVVLWGVCWMFYDSLVDRDLFFQKEGFEEEQLSWFQPYFAPEPALMFPIDTSGYHSGQFELENAFVAAPFVQHTYDISCSDFFTFSFQHISQASELAAPTPSDYSNALAYVPAINIQTSGPPSLISDVISPPSCNTFYLEPSPDTNNFQSVFDNSPPQTSQLTSPTSCFSPGVGTQTPTPYSSTPTPQRNQEGKYYCTLCTTSETWKWLSGWKTHTAKHTRPFRCSFPSCLYSSATKAVLNRHISRVHERQLGSISRFVSETPSSFIGAQSDDGAAGIVQISVSESGKGGLKRRVSSAGGDDDDETFQVAKRVKSRVASGRDYVDAEPYKPQDSLLKDRETEMLRHEVKRLKDEMRSLREELMRT